MKRRLIVSLSVLLAAVALVTSCLIMYNKGKLPIFIYGLSRDSDVAVYVNDLPVNWDDVDEYAEFMGYRGKSIGDKASVDFLVLNKVFELKADQLGISIDDDKITEEVTLYVNSLENDPETDKTYYDVMVKCMSEKGFTKEEYIEYFKKYYKNPKLVGLVFEKYFNDAGIDSEHWNEYTSDYIANLIKNAEIITASGRRYRVNYGDLFI